MTTAPTILIATYLEPHLVERISAATDSCVLYAPELLPRPRYRNEHGGDVPELTPHDVERWLAMLGEAEISFDFDWRAPGELMANAPKLRWIQATSAGIGGFVQRYGLDSDGLTLTTAAGTHAAPLAEFALAGALHFVKDVPGLQAAQRAHRFERHVSGQLAGRRATVIGLGSIGRRVAEAFHMLGAHVTGIGRERRDYDLPRGVSVVPVADLDSVLPSTEILVLACPLTPETTDLIDAGRVRSLPPGAIVVNIARGQVVDEQALIESLASGHLGGAALDVFRQEPLPADSPLWDLPGVLISPHSASTAAEENEVLTDLFIDNLHRYFADKPLRNVYRPHLGY